MSFIPSPTIAGDQNVMVDLLHALRDAINDNGALTAWCLAVANRRHTIFVGVDERNPPDESQYPLVHLYPMSESGGAYSEAERYVLGCTIGFHDESQHEPVASGISELESVAGMPVFAKLVQAAINSAIPAEFSLADVSVEYETVEFFPFLLAVLELSFIRPSEFRQRFA